MDDDEKKRPPGLPDELDEDGRDADGNYVDDMPLTEEEEEAIFARMRAAKRANEERRREREEQFATRFPEQCISFRIRRLSRLSARLHERGFRADRAEKREKLELRSTQVAVLAAIARKKYPDITTAARDLGLHRTTLSRSLSRLEKRGLVKLVDGRDHRSRRAQITKDGYEMLLAGVRRLTIGYATTMLDFRLDRLAALAPEIRHLMFVLHDSLKIPRPRLPDKDYPPA